MYNLGVIHARGGSKRIPLKNIKYLNGIPLIGYIIKAAQKSKLIDRLIVSSDHPEIINISKSLGAEVPFIRPPEISNDCPSELVTQHAVKFIEKNSKKKIDLAVTFQPTTPFCSPDDIDKCIQILTNNKHLNSVFSAQEITERPEWMFIEKNDKAVPFLNTVFSGDIGVVQTLPKMFHPNGGIYVTKKKALFEENALICKSTHFHCMDPEYSVDIDEMIDFERAEFLIKNSIVNLDWMKN